TDTVLWTDDLAESGTVPIEDNSRAPMALLSQAYRFARNAGVDVWDFALEIKILLDAGLTISDRPWLVARGIAKHGQETSFDGDPHRSFRYSRGLNFVPTTCFVLTRNDAELAGRFLKGHVSDRHTSCQVPIHGKKGNS